MCRCGRLAQCLNRTLCRACYERNRRRGLLSPRPTDEERFFSKVVEDAASGCWLWTAAALPLGYGAFRVKSGTVRAHRWAYEFLVADIPDGLHLDHLCRNPPCVNPWHLEPVTHSENIRRGVDARLGMSCARGHPRAEWGKGGQCLVCRRIAYAARNNDERRAAHAALSAQRQQEANERSLASAHRWGYQWTGPELEIVERKDLAAPAAAAMLGRSVYAVNSVRQRLTKEPMLQFVAGTKTAEARRRIGES